MYNVSVNFETIKAMNNQVKLRYAFLSIISLSFITVCGAMVHSNYELAASRNKMAESIREYVLIKPFPILCRDGTYLGGW